MEERHLDRELQQLTVKVERLTVLLERLNGIPQTVERAKAEIENLHDRHRRLESWVTTGLEEVKGRLKEFVTWSDYRPARWLLYGIAGTILATVIRAMVSGVIRVPGLTAE
jgi:hypothetical protein